MPPDAPAAPLRAKERNAPNAEADRLVLVIDETAAVGNLTGALAGLLLRLIEADEGVKHLS